MKVKSNKSRVCPFCNKESILYYKFVNNGNYTCYYKWVCFECEKEGEEWYRLEFTGHNIIDENGDNVEIENNMIESESDL